MKPLIPVLAAALLMSVAIHAVFALIGSHSISVNTVNEPGFTDFELVAWPGFDVHICGGGCRIPITSQPPIKSPPPPHQAVRPVALELAAKPLSAHAAAQRSFSVVEATMTLHVDIPSADIADVRIEDSPLIEDKPPKLDCSDLPDRISSANPSIWTRQQCEEENKRRGY